MIANFFQSLDARKVAYLLISGQATVLYGAATFSEDIDLWIYPEAGNRDRFIAALRDCDACYYKLTPSLTVENLQRGHGFHFVLARDESAFFLDVMGVVPRTGSFSQALESARDMKTRWGTIRTIGLQPLVELKKTQRLEDYPIISKLAVGWFDQPECAHRPDDFRWALRNIFTLPELRTFFEERPDAIDALSRELTEPLMEFAQQTLAGAEIAERVASLINADLQKRIADHQQADRYYWRDVIADLKRLRVAGKLMAEGAQV